MEQEKKLILDALSAWIRQRPGLEYGNYGCPIAYRMESRSITKDLHHAQELMAYVRRRDSITAENLLDAARTSYSGRLSLVKTDKGYTVDYCTGQYWPTEYRRAVCAILYAAIWERMRADLDKEIEQKADRIRRTARREFSRSVAIRWFR